jgi:hypothetical protein
LNYVLKNYFCFRIECKLNVHKRCTRNVANDCGLDRIGMARVLADLNINTEPQKMVKFRIEYFRLIDLLFYLDKSAKRS